MNIAVICISENQNIFSDGARQWGQINAWGARCFARRRANQRADWNRRTNPPCLPFTAQRLWVTIGQSSRTTHGSSVRSRGLDMQLNDSSFETVLGERVEDMLDACTRC